MTPCARNAAVWLPLIAAVVGLSPAASLAAPNQFDIGEFRVEGNHVLPARDVEAAVYDYLGPNRTTEDVEKARAALEDLYQKRGYPTVTVEFPQQPAGAVIRLVVTERAIGRLRVREARYFEPDAIRRAAPSLAPGTVPNMNDVQHDMVALNRLPGRIVKPDIHPGRDPNTLDADLVVTDQFPLHGTIELNNRRAADTTPLRLAGSVGYDNLWQRGDGIAMFFQTAPENTADALVWSVSYTFRIPGTDMSVLVSYLKSDSNVAAVGGTNVIGKGQILGARLQVPLPGGDGFSQDVAAGADYKDYAQVLTLSGTGNKVPLSYYPVSIAYNATWTDPKYTVGLNTSAVMGTPGLGSSTTVLDENRAYATQTFLYVRSTLTYTRELPAGFQFWAKAQGQATTSSLIPQEQFAAGGADTVRGYLEAEVLGDNAANLQVELRGPSLAGSPGRGLNELRPHLFADVAETSINQPLSQQRRAYALSSAGLGFRARIADHATAAADTAFTFSGATTTRTDSKSVLFRILGDF